MRPDDSRKLIRPFPFLLLKETFLYGREDLPIGPFYCAVGLGVIHGSEAELRSNRLTILPEILAVELLSIVNSELFGYSKSAYNLLPKEFSDGC
jgi:hypothetical protein